MYRRLLFLAIVSLPLMEMGCRHHSRRYSESPPSRTFAPPKMFRPETIPPANIPPTPGATPPATSNSPEILLPQGSANSNSLNSGNRSGGPTVRLLSPVINEEEAKKPQTNSEVAKPVAPSATLFPSTNGNLPLGIAEFQPVNSNLSTGLRPDLEGLIWLQQQGFRSALFLRTASEDDSSDRTQFTKRSMSFRSVVIDAETIDLSTIQAVVDQLKESSTEKVFVYDRDGSRVGPLMYAKFRQSDGLSNEDAFSKSQRFGLKSTDRTDNALIKQIDRLIP
jgi:protein tyrosine phosphatase (PTP) superfamily phosphohydrolase (DUF442 family)